MATVETTLFNGRPPLRVALAGLGRAVFNEHLPALKALSSLFTVTAVCDERRERRERVQEDYPTVHPYRRVEDMLDDPEIDIVDIALPTNEHQCVALASLQRNRWTVLETPFATQADEALILKGAGIKARNKLIPYSSAFFNPDFQLALQLLDDTRLGELYEVRLSKQDFIRRADWQCMLKCHGGAAWYAGQDLLLQAMALMRSHPTQLWSDLKRLASLGDAEDYMHIVLRSRSSVTCDIEFNGGYLPPFAPAFTLRGMRGTATIEQGASTGILHVIEPDFTFPTRRASVRTGPLDDMHEKIPIVDFPVSLREGVATGAQAFWRALAETIRTAAPFSLTLNDVAEVIRYLQLIKKTTAFAK